MILTFEIASLSRASPLIQQTFDVICKHSIVAQHWFDIHIVQSGPFLWHRNHDHSQQHNHCHRWFHDYSFLFLLWNIIVTIRLFSLLLIFCTAETAQKKRSNDIYISKIKRKTKTVGRFECFDCSLETDCLVLGRFHFIKKLLRLPLFERRDMLRSGGDVVVRNNEPILKRAKVCLRWRAVSFSPAVDGPLSAATDVRLRSVRERPVRSST